MTSTILSLHLRVRDKAREPFVAWQGRLNSAIASSPGFVSLEILSPACNELGEWRVVQRFDEAANLHAWRYSAAHRQLLEELTPLLEPGSTASQKEEVAATFEGGVTEVFVTEITAEKESDFRKWIAKIHAVEARFPGFKGMYVQAPSGVQARHWMTLLQFDTQTHLDDWLSSPERATILEEATPFIASLERHRVISPFAGWFATLAKTGEIPPIWKQTLLILLVLFPVIMLEIRFLSPWTAGLNPSLATFIGNAISVTLVSWPLMPLAIGLLGWWLAPKPTWRITFLGIGCLCLLYLFEIVLLWVH